MAKQRHSHLWVSFFRLSFRGENDGIVSDNIMCRGGTRQMNDKKKTKPKIKTEKLSRKDIEELMGMKRDTYKRHNGAIRKK